MEQTPAVHATLHDPSLKSADTKYLFSFDDQQLVEAMIAFLKPFKEATVKMSRDDVPSLPALYPTYKKLFLVSQVHDDDVEPIKRMKIIAKSNLERRYTSAPGATLLV